MSIHTINGKKAAAKILAIIVLGLIAPQVAFASSMKPSPTECAEAMVAELSGRPALTVEGVSVARLDAARRKATRRMEESVRMISLAPFDFPNQPVRLDESCYEDQACWNMADALDAVSVCDSPSKFQSTLAAQRLAIVTALASVELAGLAHDSDGSTLSNDDSEIYRRSLQSDIFRSLALAMRLKQPLAVYDERIFGALVRNQLRRFDDANVDLVFKRPNNLVSMSGDVARRRSKDLFLFVQHADNHPLAQLRGLQLLLAAPSGTVPPDWIALLTDRVMLKLFGTQKYGTQLSCAGGKGQPTGSGNVTEIRANRARLGLDPLEKYAVRVGLKCS